MALGQKKNTYVNPLAADAMEKFKYEVAQELGIQTPQGGYWGTMTTRDTGAIGGNMVRKMVEAYENQLAGTAATGYGAGYGAGTMTTGGQAGGQTPGQTGGQAGQTGGQPAGGRNTDTLPTGRTQYGRTGGTRY